MNILWTKKLAVALSLMAIAFSASAQKYSNGLIDKTIAVVGNEMIMLSDLEEEVQVMKAYGMLSDKSGRCEILETMMSSKLFLMQARVDSGKQRDGGKRAFRKNRYAQNKSRRRRGC